ncbi:PTS system protein [Klebsiella michiganensis]|uniref:PTS system protein n=1 Tax=Klebsiella michiganensis TaxID=1134687 RepID=A0A7H4MTC9_9ENTR|nr:PTS system protein [Klebsiella michiganensis]
MTGMHRVFTPTIIQTIAETGKEGMVMPSEIGANLSLGGSSLAVAWKPKTRSCARRRWRPRLPRFWRDFRTGAVRRGGAAEATADRQPDQRLYLRRGGRYCRARQPLNGGAGAVYQRPVFRPANPMTIVWVFGVMALAVVLSFVLTLMLGFEDIPQEEAAADARQRQAGTQASHA